MSCFEILWETVKNCDCFEKNRDFIDVLISRIIRARARVRPLVQIKNAPERAHARAKSKKKISILVILREGKQTDFNYFTSGCTDRF